IKQPSADLTLDLAQAVIAKQTIDQVTTHVVYQDTLIEVPSLEVRAGPNRLSLAATFHHPSNGFQHGEAELSLQTNSIQLAQVQYLKESNPGLAGTVQASIKTKGRLDSTRESLPVDLSELTASINAQGLSLNGANYGGLTLTAEKNAKVVDVKLESDVAKS